MNRSIVNSRWVAGLALVWACSCAEPSDNTSVVLPTDVGDAGTDQPDVSDGMDGRYDAGSATEDQGADGGDAGAEGVFEACERSLYELRDDLDMSHPRRNSGDYSAPDVSELQALRASLIAGFAGKVEESETGATAAGYDVCITTNQEQLVWAPTTAGRALIMVSRAPESRLVLEHPHPFFDGTLEGALSVYESISPVAMVISGTHRCASSEQSSCDGRTSVCDDERSAYRISDAAHNVTTTFQTAHVVLAETFPAASFVSLHGTGQDVSYVSDGTRGESTGDDAVAALIDALATEFPSMSHRSCDDYDAAVPGPWLCGTTNVQGRHLNGASDACVESADTPSGRFIHLEQPRGMRDEPAAVARALLALE